MNFNAAAYCLSRGEPSATALVVVDDVGDLSTAQRWTYAELIEQVSAIAAGLHRAGLRPGQRVLLRLGNTAGTALSFLAVMAAGLVAVPTSHLLTAAEAQLLLHDCAAAAVLLDDELPLPVPAGVLRFGPADLADWVRCGESGRVAPGKLSAGELSAGQLSAALSSAGRLAAGGPAGTQADDPAFLVYTSGTESKPKGVLHAHRSVLGRTPMISAWQDLGPRDVLLHAGALSWTYTLGVGLLDPWAAGATAVVYAGPRPSGAAAGRLWWGLLNDCGATVFAAVPGVYRQLLTALAEGSATTPSVAVLPALRHGLTAGEALPVRLWQEWTQATGLPLYEALGMSEISTFVSSGPRVPTRPGSPGRPQPGRRVAVLPSDPADGDSPLPMGAVGLLAVHRSDPGLMLGYLDRPEAERAAFRGEWFVSGDVVHLDDDGYLTYYGRVDDVLTTQGYRISPAEVEAVLAAHELVHEVAVTEVESVTGRREIRAFAVPAPGRAGRVAADPEASAAAVLAASAGQLASYKLPRGFTWVETLPRTPNGKLRRAELRWIG